MIDWTGERYLPEVGGQIELEHLHRYIMVLEEAKGKRVLDIACGEGYGSNLLSSVAKSVVGVDIAEEAISHANEKYKRDTLQFISGSCAAIPLADNSIDLIVSFETIEHHDEHEKMFDEFLRVLTPDGIIIVSSPDKREYSDVPNYINPYHVKELYCEEFERLVRAYFKNVRSLGQRVVYGSLILSDKLESKFDFQAISDEKKGFRALYNIILATNRNEDIPELSGGVLEGDVLNTDLVLGLQSELNELSNDHKSLTNEHNLLINEHNSLTNEQNLALDKIEALNYQLTKLYESFSWKITNPLRKISASIMGKKTDV